MTIYFTGGAMVSTWGTDDKGEQLWRARLGDSEGRFTTASTDIRLPALKKLALRAISDAIG